MLKKPAYNWTFTVAVPPREVFAVMEQMLGVPPFRYEVISSNQARVIEVERIGFFGQWSKKVRLPQIIVCSIEETSRGTKVIVEASKTVRGGLPVITGLRTGRGVEARALQLVQLLSRGTHDPRTIYRRREIPPGPVTLVASWASMPYRLYTKPDFTARRELSIHTATPLTAIKHEGPFTLVGLPDGSQGWVERDQIVAAPAEATRRAQEITAQKAG